MAERLALLLVLAAFLLSCGGRQGAETAHRVLDVVTVIADPLIKATMGLCEALVIATDEIQDDEKADERVQQIDRVCSAAIETFEDVADVQRRARDALEKVEAGELPIREAAQAILRVQEAYESAKKAAAAVEALK